jgi:hypothetical protein
MGKKKPWCLRTKAQSNYVVKICMDIFAFRLVLLIKVVFMSLALIYGTLLFSSAVYEELTGWGDFWDTLESDLGLFYLTLACWVVAVCVTTAWRLRAKRLLLPARCQICPNCFYDLSARPRDDDSCPECGRYTPRRECVRLWCILLRSRF